MVDRWTRTVLGYALPRACHLCGAQAAGGPVCGSCLADLPRIGEACPRCGIPVGSSVVCGSCATRSPPVDRVVAALEFTGAARALVHGLKFQRHLPLAVTLGIELAGAVREQGPTGVDLLVPVPLHRRRLRERGFNQATELARVVGVTLGLPVARPGVVVRERFTSPQSDLGSADARLRNVAKAFWGERRALQGRRVALVDDVMTTGATLYELARAVRDAGAPGVEVWVCCRAMLSRRRGTDGTPEETGVPNRGEQVPTRSGGLQVSRLATESALVSMKSRRGST